MVALVLNCFCIMVWNARFKMFDFPSMLACFVHIYPEEVRHSVFSFATGCLLLLLDGPFPSKIYALVRFFFTFWGECLLLSTRPPHSAYILSNTCRACSYSEPGLSLHVPLLDVVPSDLFVQVEGVCSVRPLIRWKFMMDARPDRFWLQSVTQTLIINPMLAESNSFPVFSQYNRFNVYS